MCRRVVGAWLVAAAGFVGRGSWWRDSLGMEILSCSRRFGRRFLIGMWFLGRYRIGDGFGGADADLLALGLA